MEAYSNIAALDMDGVIADTMISHIRQRKDSTRDIRVEQFLERNAELIKKAGLHSYDIEGISIESLTILAKIISESNTGLVLVSSWISTTHTYKLVNEIFKQLSGIAYDKDFVFAQVGAGGGGTYRELRFLHWCKQNLDPEKPIGISAIDDSGENHFPIMESLNMLVTPNGRTGFNADSYIHLISKLNYTSPDWSSWLEQNGEKYLIDYSVPRLPLLEFWNVLMHLAVEDLTDAFDKLRFASLTRNEKLIGT